MTTSTSTPARQAHLERGPRLFTYKQAGDILGVSDRTVFSLVNDGKLKCVRFGRNVRVSAQAIQHFIMEHEGRLTDAS